MNALVTVNQQIIADVRAFLKMKVKQSQKIKVF